MTEVRVEVTEPRPYVPDVGERFTHTANNGIFAEHTFRVDAWLRRRPTSTVPEYPRPPHQELMFCQRDEAEYVAGVGVCGCIVALRDLTIIGVVGWDEATIAESRRTAERLAGHPVT